MRSEIQAVIDQPTITYDEVANLFISSPRGADLVYSEGFDTINGEGKVAITSYVKCSFAVIDHEGATPRVTGYNTFTTGDDAGATEARRGHLYDLARFEGNS